MSDFHSKAEEPWRLLLDPKINPVVLARVCRWGRPHSDDISTEILRLAHMGVIKVQYGQRTNAAGVQVWDWRLSREPRPAINNGSEGELSALDPIDAITLKMLFDVVGKGADELWLGELHRYARAQAAELRKAVTAWQAELAEELKRQNAFSSASVVLGRALPFVAGACALIGLLATLGTGSPLYVACSVILAVVLVLAGRQMPRLSPCAAEQYEAARQLRAWLRELPNRGYGARVPDDPVFWGVLMPLAFMLGEAKNAIAALRHAVPEVIDDANRGVACAETSADGLRELAWPEWYEDSFASSSLGEDVLPCLAAFLPACIHSAAFASNATVANQMITALNNPVTAVVTIGEIPGVFGVSYELPSAAELFVRHVKRPIKGPDSVVLNPADALIRMSSAV
ncbi:MAG: DUF2207 domain-containing protein [Eggerthellaceae bacterium]|nr:DUF2207 domain-containing protein [Eggerthellaceae bacterium]